MLERQLQHRETVKAWGDSFNGEIVTAVLERQLSVLYEELLSKRSLIGNVPSIQA